MEAPQFEFMMGYFSVQGLLLEDDARSSGSHGHRALVTVRHRVWPGLPFCWILEPFAPCLCLVHTVIERGTISKASSVNKQEPCATQRYRALMSCFLKGHARFKPLVRTLVGTALGLLGHICSVCWPPGIHSFFLSSCCMTYDTEQIGTLP